MLTSSVPYFYLRRSEQVNGSYLAFFFFFFFFRQDLSNKELWRPEKHWDTGYWGHGVQIWVQNLPLASEITVIAVQGNMHIDAEVIGVACIKSEVKFDI